MPPTPPPPEPVEPPVGEHMLPAGGYPYDGLFRSPSMLFHAGAMNVDKHRQDLPNPLISTESLFPELAQLRDQQHRRLSGWSDTSDRSDRSRANSLSQPPTPRPEPAEPAFGDPFFRTLPPPTGMALRPFPLPNVHPFTLPPNKEAEGDDDYIMDASYGGPNLNYINSFDMVPWHVTFDWKNRDVNIKGEKFRVADLGMQGRGAKRHVRVWQKKAESAEDNRDEDVIL